MVQIKEHLMRRPFLQKTNELHSRRMRLASLDMWPDAPHLDNQYRPYPGSEVMNAPTRFMFGLKHDHDHLGQIAEIVRQAKAAQEKKKTAA